MAAPLLVKADPPELDEDIDPTDFEFLFFRKVKLTEDQRKEIERDLSVLYNDAIESRGDLDQMLAHWNDMAEGIAQPKDFPWQDCYSKDTEILTDSGWKLVKDTTVNDLVYSVDPKTMKASCMPVLATQKVYAEKLIRMSNKSVDLAVTPNHQIFLWSQLSRKCEFISAEKFLKIKGHEFKIPLTSEWVGEEHTWLRGFKSEDWMSFLGWYISEGWTFSGGTIGIGQSRSANPRKCLELESLFRRMGLKFSEREGTQFLVSCKTFSEEAQWELRSLGASHQKFIPRRYFSLSSRLLGMLLDSMIDGDGHRSCPMPGSFRKKDHCSYSTVSKRLADDVQELCQKIGMRGTISSKNNLGGIIRGRKIISSKEIYTVSINIKTKAKAGQLKRGFIPYGDFAYCVTTPHHTVYVRRNGIAQWCGNSSNLFVPITEIHLNNLHASARQTMLKADQLAYVKQIGFEGTADGAAKAEKFLNYKCSMEIPVADRFNQCSWASFRDGTVIAQTQWVHKKEKISRIVDFKDPREFIARFPDADAAGLSQTQYVRVLDKLNSGKPAALVITKEETTYRGPSITAIQLSDFIMAPMTSAKTDMARLVGKRFEMMESDLKAAEDQWGWQNIDRVITRATAGLDDLSTSLKDSIEGIYRKQMEHGAFVLADGIHRYDLDGDGIAERYLFVFHPLTKALVDYLYYPYTHGRDCLVPVRIKKRPGRFLGRGICQMLDDVNSEVNTQHNQRIDSRTISTVPTFKALNTAKGTLGFDPSRPQNMFHPGGMIWLTNMTDVEQFKIQQTDMGETLQEESTLFSLADQLTGSSQLRSGKETKADPRAPAAKVNMLLNQSNIRMDDYFEEMAGSAIDNEGFNAVLTQILEMYHQFHDPDLDAIPEMTDAQTAKVGPDGKPIKLQVERKDLEVRGKLKVMLAKTSSAMNPDVMFLKFMQIFSLIKDDPISGGTPKGHLALIKNLLAYARAENPEQYLPTQQSQDALLNNPDLPVIIQGLASQMAAKMGGKGVAPKGKGGGNVRTRGGQEKAGTPSAPGTTRPTG